ncbi:MAG: 3-deoxy-manno-octulosonate cytidylyltransferase [Syntrophaceae bacterium]
MRTVAVIPARYASTRFPGKPLVDINGKTMLQMVYEEAVVCEGIDEVIIATDDERIMAAASACGARAVMTSDACRSGTDRVAEAVKDVDADAVINIQGDQVIMDKQAISAMIAALESGCPMVTVAAPASPQDATDPNTVKVVMDLRGDALYFSRSAIPFERNPGHHGMLKHVGLYGFSRATLLKFTRLAQTPLEMTESLEQLRALENGIPIRVVLSEGNFFEINTPEDRERLIKQWPA